MKLFYLCKGADRYFLGFLLVLEILHCRQDALPFEPPGKLVSVNAREQSVKQER